MFNSVTQSKFAPPHQPEYEHTQTAPMGWLITLPGLALIAAGLYPVDPNAVVPLVLSGAAIVVIGLSFQWMRVVDEGDALAVRYGPLPLFHKRIRYERITAVACDRTSFIDGWGIHWVPGRGWTYNLWGFDCVRLTLQGNRILRIGTDDPAGLKQFLDQQCARGGRAE